MSLGHAWAADVASKFSIRFAWPVALDLTETYLEQLNVHSLTLCFGDKVQHLVFALVSGNGTNGT